MGNVINIEMDINGIKDFVYEKCREILKYSRSKKLVVSMRQIQEEEETNRCFNR